MRTLTVDAPNYTWKKPGEVADPLLWQSVYHDSGWPMANGGAGDKGT